MRDNCFVLALKDGEIIHIEDLTTEYRGAKCGCICPDCHKPLVARMGEFNAWHFAHAKETSCKGNGESLIHSYAKKVIEEFKYITIPGDRKVEFTFVEQEERRGETVVDVLGTTKKNELAIEIFYKHKTDRAKIEKLKEHYNYVLEIDLPKNFIFTHTEEEFQDLVLNTADREWIVYNGNTNLTLKELDNEIYFLLDEKGKITEEIKKQRSKIKENDELEKEIIKTKNRLKRAQFELKKSKFRNKE